MLVFVVAAVLALNCVAPAFAANASLDVEEGKEISKIITDGETYTVQGLVVASNSRGVVITDGNAGVMIYGSAVLDVVALGDFIEITATASEYNNILQLNYTSETPITKLESEKPTEPTATELTAEKAQQWQTAAGQDPSGLSVADVQPYSWTATATRVGSYWALSPDWAAGLGFDVEPLYVNSADFTLQQGVEYNVEGYFIGFNNTSSTPFAGMMLTKLKAVENQVEVVVTEPYVAVEFAAGYTYKPDVKIENATEQDYSVTSSDVSVATWDAEKGVLTVVGAGTTTLTVTAAADETKSANITFVAYDQYAFSLDEITAAGTYWTTGTVVAKTSNAAIVADSTGGVMVYDVKQVADLAIGTVVEVAGTVSAYKGLWQFSYNPGVVVKKVSGTPYAPTAAHIENADLVALIEELSQADVKLYSWTGVAGLHNGYNTFNIDYDGVVIESEVQLPDVVLGTTYNFTGYFVGYDATNKYASFVIDTPLSAASEQQPYLGFNRDEINLGIGSTYTLSPILGGAVKDATVEYSGYDESVISIVDGVVTGLKEGNTKITASVAGYADVTRTIEVHVSTAIDQVNTPNQFYTVVGKVVAKTTQSLVIHDGTSGILVYDRDTVAKYDLDDILQVSGYVSLFNNMLQFSYSGSLNVVELQDREINVPAATELTPAIATGWASLASPILPEHCQEYTWSATVGKSGNFFTINIKDSETVIEPAYMPDTFTLTEGETVTVTGYFIGYSTTAHYAAIAITNVEHAQA